MLHATELLSAIDFATRAHNGQMRSGTNWPYIVHPIEVAWILSAHWSNAPVELLQAGVLHDVLEDTPTKYGDIASSFGSLVAGIVQEVTDDQALTKKEQRAALLLKIPTMSDLAKLVKLADGISNVRATNRHCPEGWSRSLKLAYVKTCEKVSMACRDEGMPVSFNLASTFDVEVQAARKRLKKENYVS